MAAVGVPMRTLQEWMGHKDFATTLKFADYAPDLAQGAAFAELAFGNGAAATRSVGAEPLHPRVDEAPRPYKRSATKIVANGR